MARFGFITAEFEEATFGALLDRIVAAGADAVQLDLASAVGATFPATLSEDEAASVRQALAERSLAAAGLTGCYNMIHPDLAVRAAGRADLARLIPMARALGIPVVSLCTGSRAADNMWRAHPDNDSPEAWRDLVAELEALLPIAEAEGIALGVETEIANTVNSPAKARRLLDEMRSPSLGIVMDGANVFAKGELARMHAVLDETFALLGGDIVLAHAKDLDRDGAAGELPAGRGRLDYDHYLRLLVGSGFDGAIILHSLKPAEARDRLAFVRGKWPTPRS